MRSDSAITAANAASRTSSLVSADVNTQLAASGNHIHRTCRNLQLSDRAHQSGRAAAALLDGKYEFGGSGGGVAAQMHRNGSRSGLPGL